MIDRTLVPSRRITRAVTLIAVVGIRGGSVEWVDQQGTIHEDGWPSCLDKVGQAVRISFGEVPVTAPDGSS